MLECIVKSQKFSHSLHSLYTTHFFVSSATLLISLLYVFVDESVALLSHAESHSRKIYKLGIEFADAILWENLFGVVSGSHTENTVHS